MKGKKCPNCGCFTFHDVHVQIFGENINHWKTIQRCSRCGYTKGIKKGEMIIRY